MKTIEPIIIWNNGISENATILNASVIEDDMKSRAKFQYSLLSEDKKRLQGGIIIFKDEDYENYLTNEDAWNIIANKLKLKITGDYIRPVPQSEDLVK